MISDYDENGPSYDELYDLTMERYQNEWYASPDQMNNDHWKFMTGIFTSHCTKTANGMPHAGNCCISYEAYDMCYWTI